MADQSRFAHTNEYKYIKVFGKLYDWIIVHMENIIKIHGQWVKLKEKLQ